MSTTPRAASESLARQFFACITDHDLAGLRDLLAEDFVMVYGTAEYDAATFIDNEATYLELFPDLRYAVDDLRATAELVAVRCTVTGTHEGSDGPGVFADVDATGNEFEVVSTNVLHVADGRVTELWSEWDALGMYEQLGLVRVEAA
ncbi:ester cyclase [Haloarchaeobius amylolyticus]|uniref:ester cyclase n=1 Tax=Haloarchaeobius amylolyticus TaxID=1198296 RepID=UPI002270C56E|nr:ester cyclase [Haloarchaeobius amylolyticus]